MRRLENVRGEFSLTALAYNIRRATTLAGIHGTDRRVGRSNQLESPPPRACCNASGRMASANRRQPTHGPNPRPLTPQNSTRSYFSHSLERLCNTPAPGMSRRIGGEPFLRLASKPEPEAALNLVGIDGPPPAGAKAIAKVKLHVLGDLNREASHDLIGKPGILVCECGRASREHGRQIAYHWEDFKEGLTDVLNGDGGGDGSIIKEGSKTDPGIGTHSPLSSPW